MKNAYCLPTYEIGDEHSSVLEEFFKKSQPKGKCFDIGCGSGRNSIFAKSNGLDVYSADMSKVALERLENKSQGKIKTFNCALEDVKFENDFFENIILWRVLHIGTLSHAYLNFSRISKMLCPNGYLYLAVAADEGDVYEMRKSNCDSVELNTFVYSSSGHQHVKHYYSLEELTKLLNDYSIIDFCKFDEISGHNTKISHRYWGILAQKNGL